MDTLQQVVPLMAHSPLRHVLLVEDYEPNVLVASAFLEEFGYTYDVALNGMEAVEKVKKGHYSVVLMDVQMPGMNGFEATRLIREFEREYSKAPLPIIGMTAHALEGDKERCLAMGMNDYIAKPFHPKTFQDKLNAMTISSTILPRIVLQTVF